MSSPRLSVLGCRAQPRRVGGALAALGLALGGGGVVLLAIGRVEHERGLVTPTKG